MIINGIFRCLYILMMDNNNILGILDTGEEIVIRGEKWKFLAQGQGHIIL